MNNAESVEQSPNTVTSGILRRSIFIAAVLLALSFVVTFTIASINWLLRDPPIALPTDVSPEASAYLKGRFNQNPDALRALVFDLNALGQEANVQVAVRLVPNKPKHHLAGLSSERWLGLLLKQDIPEGNALIILLVEDQNIFEVTGTGSAFWRLFLRSTSASHNLPGRSVYFRSFPESLNETVSVIKGDLRPLGFILEYGWSLPLLGYGLSAVSSRMAALPSDMAVIFADAISPTLQLLPTDVLRGCTVIGLFFLLYVLVSFFSKLLGRKIESRFGGIAAGLVTSTTRVIVLFPTFWALFLLVYGSFSDLNELGRISSVGITSLAVVATSVRSVELSVPFWYNFAVAFIVVFGLFMNPRELVERFTSQALANPNTIVSTGLFAPLGFLAFMPITVLFFGALSIPISVIAAFASMEGGVGAFSAFLLTFEAANVLNRFRRQNLKP